MHADLNTVCVPEAFMLHSSFRVLILCFPCEREEQFMLRKLTVLKLIFHLTKN